MEVSENATASSFGRLRPESSTSSQSRFTPQSSSNSSSNLQNRALSGMRDKGRLQDGAAVTRRESSGSSLLQERLKEKKVARLSERHQIADMKDLPVDAGPNGSSQSGSGNRPGRDRDVRPGSSAGRLLPANKKTMGFKEMEMSVSTLHKQNFDLKLELFHRRERQTELEERLEAAEAQIAEQAEMQVVNEQLLAELEKRDQAVEEAVGIICALEEKLHKLTRERSVFRSYDTHCESDYFQRSLDGQASEDPKSSPPQRAEQRNKMPIKPVQQPATSKSVGRMPSFLSEQSDGAEALRSLYLGSEPSTNLSIPKMPMENNVKDDSEEVDNMDSPQLSVLSESSFLSVYGDKQLPVDTLDLNDGSDMASPPVRRHRKSLSIEKWVDERAKAAKMPAKRPSSSKVPSNSRHDQYPSILNVLESPLQRLEKMERTLSRHNPSIRLFSQPMSEDGSSDNRPDNQGGRDIFQKFEMTTFGNQQALPPTPDTISTNTLRRFKNSNDTLGAGAVDEEPNVERLDNNGNALSYNSSLNVRPHSAGETVTSRREGHGWDTVTQSEVTEASSDRDVELPSTFDPWIAMGRERRRPRIQPPDMFTFGSETDNEEEWGQDMMFNRDGRQQLPQLRDNYSKNLQEEPRSEDTIIASTLTGRSTSTYSSTQDTAPNPGLGIQPSPEPPQRRSSLAHSPAAKDKKIRKPSLSTQPSLSYDNATKGSTTTTVYADPVQNTTKRSRITSRLFSLGRSELAPTFSVNSATKANAVAPNLNRSHTDYATHPRGKRSSIDLGVGIDGLHSSSATPPPIARYPRSRTSGGPGVPRPMSASSLDSNVPGKSIAGHRQRRGYDDGFGIDGARDVRPRVSTSGGEIGNGKGDGKAPGRKWFGLGRSPSIRR